MSESISTYQKTVKLPVNDLAKSLPIRAALDDQVAQAVLSLTTHEADLKSTRTSDEGGNCRVHATAKGYDIVVTTRCGQDTVFQGGARQTFISYTISATSSLRSLNRAVAVSRELNFVLRGLGAIAFAGLFVWGLMYLLSGSGLRIRLPIIVLVGVVLGGGWIGERLGYLLGGKLESRAWSLAESSGSAPQLALLWGQLEQRINTLLRPHESV